MKTVIILMLITVFWSFSFASEIIITDDDTGFTDSIGFIDIPALDRVTYAGTGCPQGSAMISINETALSLDIAFDSYVAEAGWDKRLDRKNCALVIPMNVPEGFQISLAKTAFTGFASIPQGGSGKFSVEAFFAGSRGEKQSIQLETGDSYFTAGDFSETEEWSECGDDVNLRINTALLIKSNRDDDFAFATIDNGLIFNIKLRRCE